MKERKSLHSTDVLHFPAGIVLKQCDDKWVVVSPETANWIVLESERQEILLNRLIKGQTVGDVYAEAERSGMIPEYKRLLAAISVRKFANVDGVPAVDAIQDFDTLNIYLTNACNLRCRHCFVKAGKALANELTENEWCSVLQDFYSLGGRTITITGGEPALRSDFASIVRKAHTIGLNVTVLTNGILWNAEMISALAPYISEVQISLDGVDEMMNAQIRGEGFFEKIKKTIIAFANAGVHTSVSTTFTLETMDENTAEKYQNLIVSINKESDAPVHFKLSTKILPGRDISYTAEQNERYLKEINRIQGMVNTVNTYDFFMENHSPNTIIKNCGYGGLSIRADGEVFFCNRILDLDSCGNIRDNALEYFIRQGKLAYEKTDVNHMQPCKDCYLKYFCGGGCRIDECNFKGKLHDSCGELRNVTCTPEKKLRLLRKMMDSYLYKYHFK